MNWFDENRRLLPWREETDPYKIWVSEIILQQTRVNQGWNYYLRFIEKFPNVTALAEAQLLEVMHVWQGLGYYSRARNMHFAAQQILKNYEGVFPNNYDEIRKLKGVGAYTAAAIASIAFKLPYPAVDGNVLRVMTRIFGIYEDISKQKTIHYITKCCQKIIHRMNPGDFNQALMELGAMQCVPKHPKCEICPFSAYCVAFNQKKVELLPVKGKKIKIKERFLHYFILINNNKTIIEQRISNDIWRNLYQFPLIETAKPNSKITKKMLLQNGIKTNKTVFIKEIKHKLTHQQLTIRFYSVEGEICTEGSHCGRHYVRVCDLYNYPFPVVMKDIINCE